MKRYITIILAAILLLLIFLAMIRGKDHFKLDAAGTLALYLEGDRFLDSSELGESGANGLPGEAILVDLNAQSGESGIGDIRDIAASLEKDKIYLIHSADDLRARRSWIWLRQMGFDNVYVLTERSAGREETRQYSFLPDTAFLISHTENLPESQQ